LHLIKMWNITSWWLMAEWRYSITMIDLDSRKRWVRFASRPFYPMGNSLRYPLNRRLDWPHSLYGL
jgi:hypothetical protein